MGGKWGGGGGGVGGVGWGWGRVRRRKGGAAVAVAVVVVAVPCRAMPCGVVQCGGGVRRMWVCVTARALTIKAAGRPIPSLGVVGCSEGERLRVE